MIQIAMICRDLLIGEDFQARFNESLTYCQILVKTMKYSTKKTSELHKLYVREIKETTKKIRGLRP